MALPEQTSNINLAVVVATATKQKAPHGAFLLISQRKSGGATQSRTGLNGFAIRCITALLSRHIQIMQRCKLQAALSLITPRERELSGASGAGDESRTRDLNLGKVALYQLSYSRIQQAGNHILSLQKVKELTVDPRAKTARPCAGNTPSTIA